MPVPREDLVEAAATEVTRAANPAPPARQFAEGVPYIVAPPPRYQVRSILLEWWQTGDLVEEIVRVVSVEAPIHVDLALQRVRDHNGVERAGSNVRANFERGVRAAVDQQKLIHDERGFLWIPSQGPKSFRYPTCDEDLRKIKHVAPEEIGLAVLYVVESQFGLPQDKLVREAAAALGNRRTGPDISDAIGQVVEDLIDTGELRRRGLQVTLP